MKILYLFLGLVVSLVLTGCQTSQQMSSLPQIKDGVKPANFYLLRPHIFVGDATGASLYFDGQLIAQLGSGDYLVFKVSPGTHTIATKLGDSGLHSQTVACESGVDYYFVARRTIEILSAADGEKMKKKLREIILN